MDDQVITGVCVGFSVLIMQPLLKTIHALLPLKKDEDTHFVTEECLESHLEKRHREILKEVGASFASKDIVAKLAEDVSDIKKKIDMIYEAVIRNERGKML